MIVRRLRAAHVHGLLHHGLHHRLRLGHRLHLRTIQQCQSDTNQKVPLRRSQLSLENGVITEVCGVWHGVGVWCICSSIATTDLTPPRTVTLRRHTAHTARQPKSITPHMTR